jgi:1-phosphatidylinositol-4-phosphate 5-kinase
LKVLKDLNYIEFEDKLKIGQYQKDSLNYLLENDSRFLAENNLMDYSLLLIKAKA